MNFVKIYNFAKNIKKLLNFTNKLLNHSKNVKKSTNNFNNNLN